MLRKTCGDVIGYCRVSKALTFKTRLSEKPFLTNDFCLREDKQIFSYQWLRTQPHFETKAYGNSEKACLLRFSPNDSFYHNFLLFNNSNNNNNNMFNLSDCKLYKSNVKGNSKYPKLSQKKIN